MVYEDQPEIDYRVTLRNSYNRTEAVKFTATPDVIETRNVNYKPVDPVHAPGQILAYSSTSSRSFNISGIKLISRTPQEAAANLQKLWLLRSWTMPWFGTSTLSDVQRERRRAFVGDFYDPQEDYGREARGTPPAVLLLSAYSSGKASKGNIGQHINRVPVVIQNISIPYPSDVDYIPAEDSNTPMPTIMTIDMTLTETHSPREYQKFNLSAFKKGLLPGF